MPRYYFKLVDEGVVYHDSEGQDFANDDDARHEAALALSEVARDVLVKDGLLHAFEIVVYNHEGGTVWRTSLDFKAVSGGAHG